MKNFRKHLSILLAAAMLFGSAQFTFAGGEDPLPEETLIEVASEIAAEEPEPESVKESNPVSETAAQELMRVPMMRTFKSAPSSDAIRFGNLIVSGFEGTLEESGTPNLPLIPPRWPRSHTFSVNILVLYREREVNQGTSSLQSSK